MISLLKKVFGSSADTQKAVTRIPLPYTEAEKDVFLECYKDTLIKHGWVIETSPSASPVERQKELAKSQLAAMLDSDLLNFLFSFKKLDNDSEDVWFTELETLTDDLSSWDNHLVIMESCVIEDSTISVILQGKDKGKFVYCNEGIYEDAEIIADNFFSFLQLHAYCVELGKDHYKDNLLWAFV